MSTQETYSEIPEAPVAQPMPELQAVLPAAVDIQQEMIDSIGRTMLAGSIGLPYLAPDRISAGNEQVRRNYGEEARTLVIPGPDVLVLDGNVHILQKNRVAELIGMALLERRIVKSSHFIHSGFFSESTSDSSKTDALSRAARDSRSIVGPDGKPLISRLNRTSGARLGIDDVVVTDMRHTIAYRNARRQLAKQSFKDVVLNTSNGRIQPSLAEIGSVLGAKDALQELSGDDLTSEQLKRFKLLSRRLADLRDSRTDRVMKEAAVKKMVMLIKEDDSEWYRKAACRKPGIGHLFFPVPGERRPDKLKREQRAKEICADCSIRETCLRKALDNHEPIGIWGGKNEEERKTL